MTFEEFQEHYERYGKCPNDAFKRKNPYTLKQLKTRYELYSKKETNVQNEVKERDGGRCQLMLSLSIEDLEELKKNAGSWIRQVDGAHVFGRGECPALEKDPENIVSLNRWSHSMIDSYRDPIKGSPITKEQREFWWKFIIGVERYESLCEKRNKLRENRHQAI